MQLEHSFTVPVPVEEAWRALLDPERVAPCFPGATLTEVTGEEFTGTVKVKLGPVSLLYKGTGRFESVDESARRVVLQASGKDSRGNGTASATVTAVLADEGDSTTVGVITDLTITGRPAQLGRGLIGDVGGKILDAFAACLATRLTGSPAGAGGASDGATAAAGLDGAAPAAPAAGAATAGTGTAAAGAATAPSGPRPATTAEEIDLIEYAGRPVLKRVAPVAVGVLALVLVLRWLRRRG